ncbi:MAG TPA: hypothetical protein VMV07_01290 [Streptosporangiaceae bacterium]|nr:hypothetical protein [Streptosporangiaceae bacterium]
MPIREIVEAAARSALRDGWRILAVAVTVSVVTALAEIAVDHLINPNDLTLSLLAGISAAAVSILGTVFLSGFLARLVRAANHGAANHGAANHEAANHGAERVTIGQVARDLPWFRLIRADLLVVLIIILGTLALVIPGLVAFTLLAVTGPAIEIENRKVLAALRRSAHLVRHHFWPVVLLATVPVMVASEVESIAPEPSGAGEILEVLAVRGILEGALEAAIGLVLVELCYRLIALDSRSPSASPASGADSARS